MQYVGQTHVLTVPIARTDFERDELRLGFEKAYWERFEVELRQMRCLVMNLRTAVIAPRVTGGAADGPLRRLAGAAAGGAGPRSSAIEPRRRRAAWFDGAWLPTPVYDREQLHAGVELGGPAIVEQLDTTTVIEPGDRMRVDELGNLEITVRAV
jgi:N-methylhydantoinase A